MIAKYDKLDNQLQNVQFEYFFIQLESNKWQ